MQRSHLVDRPGGRTPLSEGWPSKTLRFLLLSQAAEWAAKLAFSAANLGAIARRSVKDNGKLSGESHLCLLHSDPLGELAQLFKHVPWAGRRTPAGTP